MDQSQQLKDFFLSHALFAQFKNNEDKLIVNIIEEGTLDLHVKAFPGIDTEILNPRAFNTLEIKEANLKGGHISSGGPDGICVRYQYHLEPINSNINKPKFK